MLRRFLFAFAAVCALALAPPAARADDSKRLLSELRFTSIKSFKLDMLSHSPQGVFDKKLIYVAPNRLRLEIPKRNIVAVTIGSYVWIRDPQNKWHKQELPPGVDPMSAVHSITAVAKSITSKIVTYVGDETLSGVKTHVYKLVAPPKRGFSAISETLWLGVDGYPRKVQLSNGPYSMLATYTDLNAPLSVAGP
jgi:outer membrane lipoprotein-sorting protein